MPATHELKGFTGQARRMAEATFKENNSTLRVSDEPADAGVIYIYNILNKAHTVEQPPNFPHMRIPACAPGKKFAYVTIPAFIRNPYRREGHDETYYLREDGRKHAMSLVNPTIHPASGWEAQLVELAAGDPRQATDQYGNNLNLYGVWWSETPPDSPKLDGEIKRFEAQVERTFRSLIAEAEKYAAANNRESITPWMHFAMDYLGLEAPWHQSTARTVPCPNCGERIREGLAYHRNQFNEKCVIDWKRAYEAGAVKLEDVPESKRWLAAEKPEETAEAETNAAKRRPRRQV